MKLMKGNMLDVIEQSHMFVITTNGVLRKDGSLVMGKGIAKQISDKYPTIPHLAGEAISAGGFKKTYHANWKHSDFAHRYHFLQLPGTSICLFQVKTAWWDNAKLFLIHQSALEMKAAIDKFINLNKCEPVVHMNFPGIGNGGLSKEVVLPHLESVLPDFVHVWEYANIEARV